MKKILGGIVLLFLFLGVTSCNSDKNKIKTVITSFFTALNHKDPQSAKLYATKESADFLNLVQQQIIASSQQDTAMNANEKFLISDIKINGDKATASVRSESQQAPLTVSVKKVNGEWKVAFDKSSISTMLGSEMKNLPESSQQSNKTDTSNQNMAPSAPGQTLNLSDTTVVPGN